MLEFGCAEVVGNSVDMDAGTEPDAAIDSGTDAGIDSGTDAGIDLSIGLFKESRSYLDFDPSVDEYQVEVGHFLTTLTLRIDPIDSVQSVVWQGLQQSLDGEGEVELELDVMNNSLTVVATDEQAYRVTVRRAPASELGQQAYLKSNAGAGARSFGNRVAISGDTAAVSGSSGRGGVYVFRRSGGTWVFEATLVGEETEAGDSFGFSLAMDGDTIVVGAYGESSSARSVNGDATDNSASDAGAAYVFVREGTVWTQQAYLKASNADAGDRFGESIGISGDTVIVGAGFETSTARGVNGDATDNNGSETGAAYIFVRNQTAWTQQAYLKASNTDDFDLFGYLVAIDRDTAVACSPFESSAATGVNGDQNDNSGGGSGACYAFVRDGTTWAQQAYIKSFTAESGDDFGWAVAVDDDTLAVGARREDSSATGVNGDRSDNGASASGAVFVYARNGTSWSNQAYLKASNTGASDSFGTSVAIDGDAIGVGAPGEGSVAVGVGGNQSDNTQAGSGAAYAFLRVGGIWSQRAYLKASNTNAGDRFGGHVALDGDDIIVGASGEDSSAAGVDGDQNDNSAESAGAAYVFR